MTPAALPCARACAWALLIAGWVGIGSLALHVAPSASVAFAWVAAWLIALGGAASVATRGGIGRGMRSLAIAAAASATALGLWGSVNGGGTIALLAAVLSWAALTALASGVVRSLRRMPSAAPAPPVAAACVGALLAGLVLGDLGDPRSLVFRLAVFVVAVATVLVLLQRRVDVRPGAAGCRAGLFDCSLPAWPAGAWRDVRQWSMLLAGLAMLPMMAALPLMANWCRAESVPPQATLLLHLAAMFVPALLLRRWVAAATSRRLSMACMLLLAVGAAAAVWAAPPLDMLGLALCHGAAWSLAWSGQLWAPARRGAQSGSPWRAAAGYALLTLAFGLVIDRSGAFGLATVHFALGAAALGAWLVGAAADRAAPEAPPGPRGARPPL